LINQTPEELFIEYCDINFSKAGDHDSTPRTYTQFERFATYWKVFQFAFENGCHEGHEKGYTLGFNDAKTCSPDTSNYEEGYEEGFKAGYRKGELDISKEMQREIREAYTDGLYEGRTAYSIYD